MCNDQDFIKRLMDYLSRTLINKIVAIGMIAGGLLIQRLDGDTSFLMMSVLVATPMFLIDIDLFGRKD